ncbi:hypothetical protein Tco_0155912, partial [Tanacetum coccineum]
VIEQSMARSGIGHEDVQTWVVWNCDFVSDENGMDMGESGGMRRRCSDARRRNFVLLRYENKWLGVDHRMRKTFCLFWMLEKLKIERKAGKVFEG